MRILNPLARLRLDELESIRDRASYPPLAMHRVRRYSSPFVAEQAAVYLRQRGVPATVVGHHVSGVLPVSFVRFTQLELIVPTGPERDRALVLLEEFNCPGLIEADPGWEEQSTPDLTRLDPELRVRCPECGERLAIVRGDARCSSCQADLDVLNLVLDQHGPEALEGCYDVEPGEECEIHPHMLASYDLPCAECRYALGGLPARGRCPECGALYDKMELLSGPM